MEILIGKFFATIGYRDGYGHYLICGRVVGHIDGVFYLATHGTSVEANSDVYQVINVSDGRMEFYDLKEGWEEGVAEFQEEIIVGDEVD